jgi:polyphenol oxidase
VSSGGDWLFTSATDGNLALHVGDDLGRVEANRLRLQERVGEAHILRWMQQVHGDTVIEVDRHTIASHPCDALVTTDPTIALAVLVADCVPVLLSSDECIGVAHVGRRGVLNEIVMKTVATMQEMGATSISAVLGPSICGSCYEVPADMQEEIAAKWVESRSQTPRGTPSLDLPAGVAQQLREVGVRSVRAPQCTREDGAYFSHRRDSASGRFAGVIWR